MNKYDKAHLTNLNKYSNQVERIYEEAVQKAALWSVDLGGFDRKRPLTLDDYPIEERKAAKLLEWLRNGLISAITTAAKREWELSNAKNDDLCFMFRDKDGKLPRKYADPNSDALAAFLKRKRNGLKLSDRVWSYTERFREEIELGLDLGIRTGRSAAEISRDMRLFLKRPDILHRRIRTDMVDDDGNPVWKMSKAAAAYSPGRGVYRSSAANARRLAVTECNMAYRASDHERWQQLDFVAGQHVILSKRHGGGDADVCDDLSGRDENDSRGRYPKEFKFLGWHPQCRCFVVPILCDIEEMERMRDAVMEGRDYEPRVDKVEEMPKEFGEWMEKNAESIERARARGNVPYFLADNEGVIGGKGGAAAARRKGAKEVAAERHAKRSKEDIERIRERWNERRKVVAEKRAATHYGQNMLKIMGGIKDVDTSLLSEAIKNRDTATILSEGAKLKAIGKKLTGLKHVQDPIKTAKIFSVDEVMAVEDAVAKKMAAMPTDLTDLKKKLEFEISWVGEHKKYPTWEVAQYAYQAKLSQVDKEILWKDMHNEYTLLLSYKTTSKTFQKHLTSFYEAYKKKDLSSAQMHLSNAQKNKQAIENKRYKKGAKSSEFDVKDYTQEAKKKAIWNITPEEACDFFFEEAKETWRTATKEERYAVYGYTTASGYITRPLRAIKGWYNDYSPDMKRVEKDIPLITNYIARNKTTKNIWIKRDEIAALTEYKFGINIDKYKNKPQALIGLEGSDESFLSCGSCKNSYFTGTGGDNKYKQPKVTLNIYCPKNTQMTYVEPFNRYGQYDGGWDGKTKPTQFNENEILLQRGTRFRITKAEYSSSQDKWYIDVDIIAQKPKSYTINWDSSERGFACVYE